VKKQQSKKRGAGGAERASPRIAKPASRASRMPFPAADQVHASYAEWLKFAEEPVKRLAHYGYR